MDDRIRRECDYFELDGFIDDLTETYSHGMRQRLVFAAALLHDPPVLVVDEPMVGLDPRSVRATKDRLRALAADGTTVFMSTHTLAIAEEIADRIGIMDRRPAAFSGRPWPSCGKNWPRATPRWKRLFLRTDHRRQWRCRKGGERMGAVERESRRA